jgi:hypothetical protein
MQWMGVNLQLGMVQRYSRLHIGADRVNDLGDSPYKKGQGGQGV